MRKILSGLLAIALLMSTHAAQAQNAISKQRKKGKVYLSTNFDSYIFSTSILSTATKSNKWTPLRFTGFLHLGLNANYDFNDHVGLLTGFNIKNIGFTEKFDNPDRTVIRRVYTLGIPLALKIGNLGHNKTFLLLGGGVDFPFHYKIKSLESRFNNNNKTKDSEWFSNQTEQIMPYVFVGARFHPGVYLKLQYYPTNMMNTEYVSNNVKPYQDYNVNLLTMTIGFDINVTPKN